MDQDMRLLAVIIAVVSKARASMRAVIKIKRVIERPSLRLIESVTAAVTRVGGCVPMRGQAGVIDALRYSNSVGGVSQVPVLAVRVGSVLGDATRSQEKAVKIRRRFWAAVSVLLP